MDVGRALSVANGLRGARAGSHAPAIAVPVIPNTANLRKRLRERRDRSCDMTTFFEIQDCATQRAIAMPKRGVAQRARVRGFSASDFMIGRAFRRAAPPWEIAHDPGGNRTETAEVPWVVKGSSMVSLAAGGGW